MNSIAVRAFCSLGAALLFSVLSVGQVATGTPPFGSFASGTFDTVNLANLNVHFGIPIVSKPGRGLPFHYVMDYESSFWAPTLVNGSTLWQPSNASNWGWRAQSEALTGSVKILSTMGSCWFTDPTGQRYKFQYPTTTYSGYTDPNGTFHAMRIVTTNGEPSCDVPVPPVHTGTGGALDGSGYGLTVNELSDPRTLVTTRSGWTIPNPGTSTGTVIDTNGNELTTSVNGSTTTFTDTLGLTVLTVTTVSSSQTTYTYTAPSSAQATYSFNYSQHSVQTNFRCSSIGEYPSTAVWLLDNITLPDSTQYLFQYEATPGLSGKTTGRIASVTLPTGGTISYTYQGANNGITCADGSAVTLVRTTPDGTWTYTHSEGNPWTTTATDPQGNQTSLWFQGPYETQRKVYQKISGVQTLLSTVVTCYNGNLTNCTTTAVTLPVTRRTVFVQLPDSGGKQSKTDGFFNGLGLVTKMDQYGYGNGAPGSLLRETLVTYASLTNNILDHPASVTVQDSSANIIGKTTYSYDQGQVSQNSATPPQHVSVSGSRGNVTTISNFYSAASSLTSQYSYYDTGMVKVATDLNGATTTYNYSSGSTTCGFSFPDSVNLPMSLTRSTAYNCTGGVAISGTDENGATSYANYTQDRFFWRPESVQDAAGYHTTINYTGATQVESALNFNGGNSTVDALTTLDSLGRVLYTQQKQSPTSSNYDSAQRTYDAVNALVKVTVPYVGSAGQSSPPGTAVTTTNYDALGRPTLVTDGGGGTVSLSYTKNDVLQTVGPAPANERTKSKQFEYDALGRLTSVCEITTGTANGACGQTVPQNGYLTTYAYDTTTINSVLYTRTTVTQNAQPSGTAQTRTYIYDLLGRLISETNPETNNTQYFYDTAPTSPGVDCSTIAPNWTPPYTGSLVKRYDANGNTTCYTYDSLRRALTTSYSGPNAAPKKFFIYDGATVNGTAMANAKGRLAEAYTCSTCPGTKITDLGFSYTARGEAADVYQSTPHSNGYYHVNATYWENGALKVLNGAANPLPGLPQQSYGVDGEGRPSSVTAGSGQNPVTSAVYDLANQKATVTFGSLDSDVFTFDASTGRITQYKYNVGSQSVTGNLTWNANGTLGMLAIVDQMNSSDSQTCNYTYDDLGRLAGRNANGYSVDCGSSWQQQFTLDPFGNITKSGSSNFQPTYSASTNRFLTIPGGTPTYDANGNLTWDLSHNYAWDVEARVLSVDSVSLTYDALGRMVEQNRSGTYTEIVYGPTGGKLALMNGQSLQKAFVPLPAGATAVYNSTGLAYYRHADWLGSSRLASTPSRTCYYDVAYAPYGEPYAPGCGSTTDLNFTGQNQDTVSGLYDFLFREYHPVQGRWISPDPAGLAVVAPAAPQTWNRYAYVLNNPLVLVDPLGLCEVYTIAVGPPGEEGGSGVIVGISCSSGDGGGQGGVGAGGGGGGQGKAANNCKPGTPGCFNVPKPPCSASISQRIATGTVGLLNVGIGEVKTYASAALGTASVAGAPATDGLSLFGLGLAGYGIVSSQGQIASGTGQLVSAISGDLSAGQGLQQVGDIVGGPISGISTLIITGDAKTAAMAGSLESTIFAGASLVNSTTDTIQNLVDFLLTPLGLATDPACTENASGG